MTRSSEATQRKGMLEKAVNAGGSNVVLISRWGTVVCYDPHTCTMSHAPVGSEIAEATTLTFQGDGMRIGSDRPGVGAYRVEIDPQNGIAFLKSRDSYLTAHENRSVAAFQGLRNPWEHFVVLPEHDYAMLRHILTNSWIAAGEVNPTTPSDNALEADFLLRIGHRHFLLPDNFNTTHGKFDARYRGHGSQARACEITLWQDVWKPHTFTLYRPLVYFCTFGEKSTTTLNISLRALKLLGSYNGDLLIITDLQEDALRDLCPELDGFVLHVWTLPNQHNLDFYASRYRIPEWHNIYAFSPLLYMDTDILTDLPLADTLLDMFHAPKMQAQAEAFTRKLTAGSVGADLFAADTRFNEKLTEAPGFNSGLIAIPRIEQFDAVIGKIYKCIYRYADARDSRWCLSHFDQAIANYIGVTEDAFDLNPMTEKVHYFLDDSIRINDRDMSKRVQYAYAGFVHFWGTSQRVRVMNEYIDSVRNGTPFDPGAT